MQLYFIIAVLIISAAIVLYLLSSVAKDKKYLMIVLCITPLCAGGLYWILGSPDLPDMPYEKRIVKDIEVRKHDAESLQLVEQLKNRLENGQGNAEGWLLLARQYVNLDKMQDALDAYTKAMSLTDKKDATYPALLGEAAETLIFAEGKTVNKNALKMLEDVLAIQKDNPRAIFYKGLYFIQQKQTEKGLQLWKDLLKKADQNAGWLGFVTSEMKQAEQKYNLDFNKENLKLPELNSNGFTKEQMDMVIGMVKNLEKKLEKNPDDLEGWIKLGRSYEVLGNEEGVKEAAKNILRLDPKGEKFKSIQNK